MGRFKLWILIGGIAAGYYGFKEWRLSGEVKSTAQNITCEALARDGYGDNAHVRISDFLLLDNIVYEQERSGAKRWKTVWVPAVSRSGPYVKMLKELPEGTEPPPPKDFGVILQSDHIPNGTVLGKVNDQDYLAGVVINEIDSLDSETKKLLRESYPGIDVDKCWIVEHRRGVKGAMLGLGMMALGLAGIGLAAFLFFKKQKAPPQQ